MNRIRVVALYLFVARILNYVHELHNTVQESDSDVFETLDTSNNEKDREDSHTQVKKIIQWLYYTIYYIGDSIF